MATRKLIGLKAHPVGGRNGQIGTLVSLKPAFYMAQLLKNGRLGNMMPARQLLHGNPVRLKQQIRNDPRTPLVQTVVRGIKQLPASELSHNCSGNAPQAIAPATPHLEYGRTSHFPCKRGNDPAKFLLTPAERSGQARPRLPIIQLDQTLQ